MIARRTRLKSCYPRKPVVGARGAFEAHSDDYVAYVPDSQEN